MLIDWQQKSPLFLQALLLRYSTISSLKSSLLLPWTLSGFSRSLAIIWKSITASQYNYGCNHKLKFQCDDALNTLHFLKLAPESVVGLITSVPGEHKTHFLLTKTPRMTLKFKNGWMRTMCEGLHEICFIIPLWLLYWENEEHGMWESILKPEPNRGEKVLGTSV